MSPIQQKEDYQYGGILKKNPAYIYIKKDTYIAESSFSSANFSFEVGK